MTRSLIKLALEGTKEARQRLFSQVSELVISNLDQRTDRELAIFSEVIIRLYSDGSAGDRARLAQKLAAQGNTPVELARKIAEDDVAVAAPMLASYPAYTREDLHDFIERLGEEHHQVIARRADLSPEVSDALVAKGGGPVHRTLAGNQEIKLSRETMLALVKHAAEDMVLCEDLALRADLSPAACRALLPLVDGEARKRLHRIIEGALSQEQLTQIARLKALRQKFGPVLDNNDIGLLWQDAVDAEITVKELMILLLQDGRFDHAIELLSARGRTALTPLRDAVFNDKLKLVMRTAAKAGLDTGTFSLFADLRCSQLRLPKNQSSEWASAYKAYLKSSLEAKQSRCGDFQANRGPRKSRTTGDRSTRQSPL